MSMEKRGVLDSENVSNTATKKAGDCSGSCQKCGEDILSRICEESAAATDATRQKTEKNKQ